MGTLDEAFAQADEQLNNREDQSVEEQPKEEAPVAEEPSAEEPSKEVEEPKEKPKAEDKSESFSKLNPEELPDELKGVYKSLQADYTRKTQELADKRKATDRRVEELESQIADLKKKPEGKKDQQSPEDKLKSYISDTVKSEQEAAKIAGFRETAIRDYEQADDRLKLGTDTYDEATDLYVGQKMDSKLAEHMKDGEPEYTFDYKAALKDVLSDWDTYVQTRQKAYLEEQTKKAKAEAEKVSKQNPKGNQQPGRPKKMTLDEAVALAQQK